MNKINFLSISEIRILLQKTNNENIKQIVYLETEVFFEKYQPNTHASRAKMLLIVC